MSRCVITEKTPDARDYCQLRQAVGWGAHPIEQVERWLPNSLFCVCAGIDDRVVGMARIVGDGGLIFYIQDVIVLPEFQRQGIGTRMMDCIMEYIRTHSEGNPMVGLMAASEKEPFYEKYGFIRRPTDKYGAGMTMFIGSDF